MTLLLLFDNRYHYYTDPTGSVGWDAGLYRDYLKKKKLEEPKLEITEEKEPNVVEIVEEQIVSEPTFEENYSLELANQLAEFARLSQQLINLEEGFKALVLENEINLLLKEQERILQEKRAALAKLILEMQEEEEALLFLLIN